jgi:phosphoribosyl-dephospho-CoA transferase
MTGMRRGVGKRRCLLCKEEEKICTPSLCKKHKDGGKISER